MDTWYSNLKLILDVPNKQIDIVRISDEVQYTISTCTWGNPPQLAPHHNRPNRTHQGPKLLSLTFFKQALLFFDNSGMVMPCKKNKHSHIYGLEVTLLYVRLMCRNQIKLCL